MASLLPGVLEKKPQGCPVSRRLDPNRTRPCDLPVFAGDPDIITIAKIAGGDTGSPIRCPRAGILLQVIFAVFDQIYP